MRLKARRSLPAARLALGLSAIYLGACLAYIAVSGRIAARFAGSVGELESIERIKGFAFVIVMSILLFLLAWRGLRRIAAQEAEIDQRREELVDADRRALTGLLAASVAHDMNNLLQTALAGAEELKDAAGLDPAGRASVDRTNRALDGLTTLARRLVSVGRERRDGRIERLDLTPWLDDAVEFARSHPKVRAVRLTTRIDAPLLAHVNEDLLQRALLNLIINAADAVGSGGRIDVRGRRDGANIVLEVHDDGPGVPEQNRESVFEPFFTTKPDGTGLGLLSVAACAREHGGTAEVSVSDLGGAAFRMTLPVGEVLP